LDAGLDLNAGATEAEVFDAMAGHILAESKLMGSYKRQQDGSHDKTGQKIIRGKMMERKNPAFEPLIPRQATMEYTEETIGEVKVFHLRGKIMGDATTQALCGCLKDLIAAGTQSLVMDFRDVQWINSSGVGAMIACLNT
jgi:hypothetical protein